MRNLLFLALILLGIACQESTPKKVVKKVVIDPNNTSEMALLMRDMFTELESIKAQLEAGESISSKQLEFALIHEQEATDESFRKKGLEGMSIAYSQAVEAFNSSPDKKGFQTIVNNCISCHQSLCPGPLERIDNLILP
jgi:hypothetical protein